MSSGLAYPTVTEVLPEVAFPPPEALVPPPVENVAPGAADTVHQFGTSGAAGHPLGAPHHIGVPHAALHPLDALQQAGGHALHSAMHEAHQLVGPALSVLGSLSGALLAGRAVMAGAQLLSEAALRAGDAQERLREAQFDARQAAAYWCDAACAVARVNARIETLAESAGRLAADGAPGSPPGSAPGAGGGGPAPVVPPVIDPVGLSLEEVWPRLAETDCLLRAAEARHARAVLAAAHGEPAGMSAAARAWHERLRARRLGELGAYEQAAGEAHAAAHRTPQPSAFTPSALGPDEVLRQGADLLASLPVQISPDDYRLIEEKVAAAARAAASGPAAAARRLREAKVSARQLWVVAGRREEAARQLAFLRRQAPPGVAMPEAGDEIAALEAFLHHDRPLGRARRDAVDAAVRQRTDVLEQLYTVQAMGAALGAADARGIARYTTDGGTEITDWHPPGWDAEHWLRVSASPTGTVRVSTQHRPRTPDEDTPEALLLDWQRCHEAMDHVHDVRRVAGLAGLDLPFEFDEPPERPHVPAETSVTDTSKVRRPPPPEPAAHRHRDREQDR